MPRSKRGPNRYKVGVARLVTDEEVRLYQRRIGEILTDAMRERDISAMELQNKCGFHPSALVRLKKGQKIVTLGSLIRIARALDMQPSELLP